MNKIIIIVIIALLGLTLSCEQDIEIKLPDPEPKLVVEGFIEEGGFAVVYLTKNMPYFSPMDSTLLQESLLISGAVVTVSNGTNTETLMPSVNPLVFPFFYYKGSAIIGEAGKNYSLEITYEDHTLKASTSIPPSVPIDSLVFKTMLPFDSLGYVWAYVTDPDMLGNGYRAFTKKIPKEYIFSHQFQSVTDDKLLNGQVIEFPLYHGSGSSLVQAADTTDTDQGRPDGPPVELFFGYGDTVVVKFCTLDRQHFKFWESTEQQVSSAGNPFAAPTTPLTNIEGGLGVWGGYGVAIDTLIIELPNDPN